MKKYIRFNMPIEAYKLLKQKKISMEQTIQKITGKKRGIPMTNIITAIVQKPAWFENNEIKALTKRKKL